MHSALNAGSHGGSSSATVPIPTLHMGGVMSTKRWKKRPQRLKAQKAEATRKRQRKASLHEPVQAPPGVSLPLVRWS